MLVVGHFLKAIGGILHLVLNFFVFLLIARAVVSWVNADPYNGLVRFITDSTEPLLAPLRKRLPRMGMLDLSPLVLIMILYFLQSFLADLMISYGLKLIAAG